MEISVGIIEHLNVISEINNRLIPEIKIFADICITALSTGHRIFFMGNGGSASDSQHLAAELVGRFKCERRGLPGIALTTDTSIITSIGNDYGYDQVFVRQVEALVTKGDVIIGISTSGNSKNIVKAMESAKELDAITIGMTGENGGELENHCNLCIKVPSRKTARIQEAHILIGHIVCEMIDEVNSVASGS